MKTNKAIKNVSQGENNKALTFYCCNQRFGAEHTVYKSCKDTVNPQILVLSSLNEVRSNWYSNGGGGG